MTYRNRFKTVIWCYSHTKLFPKEIKPSQHLFSQGQQWKYLAKVWNLYKINNEDNKIMPIDVVLVSLLLILKYFYCWICVSSVFIVEFDQKMPAVKCIHICPLKIGNF